MKKNYLKSLLILTASLFIVSGTSCSSDDDNVNIEESKKTELLAAAQRNDSRTEFSYDSQNRLTAIKERNITNISDSLSTKIEYDSQGRISQTVSVLNDEGTSIETTYTFTYSSDSIFVKNDLNTDIDTLIVANNLLKEKRDKYHTITYNYDANGNLIESQEKNRDLTYNFKTTYTYDLAEKGLMMDTNTPYWFIVYYDLFDIKYTKNLCTGYTYYNINIKDGVEEESYSTVPYIVLYEYENGRPIKMINKDVKYNETFEYRLEYVNK